MEEEKKEGKEGEKKGREERRMEGGREEGI
jgi:hypothetical protein